MRVRAPELRGRRWLNTGGRAPDLRGKIVLLDFWTFCCVNCLHVLDELRPLEEEFTDVLVVVGVHSPKFAHERQPAAVDGAVERYGVHHPVLDDPDLAMWDAYAARAWPTLAVVDPEGYVVAQMAGEGHAHGLAVLIRELVEEHTAKGTLRRGDRPYVAPPPPATALRFPGKVVAVPDGFLVSDTAHHQVVQVDAEFVEVRRFGTGVRGLRDGSAAEFSEPQGLAVLPAEVAAQVGYDVVVADSVNHALRGLRLADGHVSTVAGTGSPLRERVEPGGTAAELSTPWDVAWWRERIVIAMAGWHQLWTFAPVSGELAVLAGTTTEGLRDGPVTDAFFAQPSGLAVAGDVLWIVDAETSAVRALDLDATPQVSTAVGLGLFDFGFRDGPAAEALLQHPLGVGVLPDGSVAVADTYNGAVRRIAAGQVTTLAQGLAEPSDVLVDGDTLVVVESAAHRLVRLPIPAGALVDAGAHTVRRPRTALAAGPVALTVDFTPPTGQHLDTRFGDPTMLTVAASPSSLLVEGGGTAPGLARALRLAPGEGVLSVSVTAAACDEGDAVFAACHRYQQDWGVPVRVVEGGDGTGPAELVLDLRAVDGR
ncbi:NHL domain-containing thioredoxin family protein [Pseudonocardia kujensis]|uniref:NHL domain-containing thioredoxin family protein n=1 Tax=Pseudonocardia kujensis TaxID=1128675 RepID=UPI001E44108E|nr:NHL domain-containing thioredoxin family protein [Pseudonocardia kujensis]MCE0766575.1 NHL domain-containing thioredoxin family protein [Pseudonocardia kujensis]